MALVVGRCDVGVNQSSAHTFFNPGFMLQEAEGHMGIIWRQPKATELYLSGVRVLWLFSILPESVSPRDTNPTLVILLHYQEDFVQELACAV